MEVKKSMIDNKEILLRGNSAITAGNNEGFLSLCSEDTVWVFVGDKTLHGKEAVRRWMKETYAEPPQFEVENLIAEGDFVTALGKIKMKDESGEMVDYSYCDVWRFRNGKMVGLTAFVIKNG